MQETRNSTQKKITFRDTHYRRTEINLMDKYRIYSIQSTETE